MEPEDEQPGQRGPGRASSSSALSELLEGLRKRRAGWDRGGGEAEGSGVSLPIYQTTGASVLRRRAASALSVGSDEGAEEPRPGILKPPSPLLPRAASLRSLSDTGPSGAAGNGKMSRFSSCDSLTASSALGPRLRPANLSIPEEEEDRLATPTTTRSPQPYRRRLLMADLAAEEGGESSPPPLGAEPLVFQNRRILGNLDDDAGSDILPAIRRAQSAGSLSGSSLRGGGTRRALSVHFGELPRSRSSSRRESDTDSSSSGGSQRRGPQGERLEAEGSEGDVTSVMNKYLRKAEAD